MFGVIAAAGEFCSDPMDQGDDLSAKLGINPHAALMLATSGEMVKLLARYGADPALCDKHRNNALNYYAEFNRLEAAKAWVELHWPTNCKENKMHNRLLARKMFDMLTVITGFVFSEKDSIGKIAEFKAHYAAGIN
ncbi:MAG: hypothetical protein ABFD79_05685 [Phycisphaerales bacterium]